MMLTFALGDGLNIGDEVIDSHLLSSFLDASGGDDSGKSGSGEVFHL